MQGGGCHGTGSFKRLALPVYTSLALSASAKIPFHMTLAGEQIGISRYVLVFCVQVPRIHLRVSLLYPSSLRAGCRRRLAWAPSNCTLIPHVTQLRLVNLCIRLTLPCNPICRSSTFALAVTSCSAFLLPPLLAYNVTELLQTAKAWSGHKVCLKSHESERTA